MISWDLIYIHVCKSGVTAAEGNEKKEIGIWEEKREIKQKTWLLIIAVLAGELKETKVRNNQSQQTKRWRFLVYCTLFCMFDLIAKRTETCLRARSGDLPMLWESGMKFS